MRLRVLIAIVVIAILIGGSFEVWNIIRNRTHADVAATETAQSFTTKDALQGTDTNKAETKDTVIDANGTIHLAPAQGN